MGRCACINLIFAFLTALATAVVAGCDNNLNISVTATQIKIVKETPGYGPTIKDGDLTTIKYRVNLPDGKEILKDDEFKFYVDSKRPTVIEGINDSVIGMRVGGSRTIDCPPHLHWGRNGTGDGAIPANTNLLIYIKVLQRHTQ